MYNANFQLTEAWGLRDEAKPICGSPLAQCCTGAESLRFRTLLRNSRIFDLINDRFLALRYVGIILAEARGLLSPS